MIIKIGDLYVDPLRVVSVRVPMVISEDDVHYVEMDVEGVGHPLIAKRGLSKSVAHELKEEYANTINDHYQSYGGDE